MSESGRTVCSQCKWDQWFLQVRTNIVTATCANCDRTVIFHAAGNDARGRPKSVSTPLTTTTIRGRLRK